jgi:hypothetical protein
LIRARRSEKSVFGAWRSVLMGSAFETTGRYIKRDWNHDLWTHDTLGFGANAVISESLNEDTKAFLEVDREKTGIEELNSMWVSRAGVAYNRRGTEGTESELRLGVEDRRMASYGAALWPHFKLRLEGQDTLWDKVYPTFALQLMPESTAWSPTSFFARAQWGLTYRASTIEIPATASVARIFHRHLIAPKRDDMLIEVEVRPLWKFASSSSLSTPIKWVRFRRLKADVPAVSKTTLYPQNSYRDLEASLRWQHEF